MCSRPEVWGRVSDRVGSVRHRPCHTPEDGNRSSSRNAVFSNSLKYLTVDKDRKLKIAVFLCFELQRDLPSAVPVCVCSRSVD
jgi:hypothetical protein